MKVEQVEHIGITVKNLDETLKFYTGVLGINSKDIDAMEIPGMAKIATIRTKGSKIELIQFLSSQDLLFKYADKQADNIHHYAINVDNILEALNAVKKEGGTLIHEKPVVLPTGRQFAYVIPKDSKVLIEFMED
jgi:methylmalonyl-CoA/ethylmalonyl-CoA epimerase